MSDSKPAEVLFPLGKEYKLESGKTVEVRKWSIQTMVRVSQRIPRALEKLQALQSEDAKASIVALFPVLMDEVTLVVGETIGWTTEQVQTDLTADDLLGLTLLIWDECLAGPMAKIFGLTLRLNRVGAQPVPTSTPSSKQ